jgi:isopentenyl-diphosphate Delta-isomerase
MEEVILVNEADEQIGTMEKMEAHQKGLLHRAFSVFVFNSKNELLVQKRALSKYHSPGLWTNTCCSHPRPGEKVLEAAKRRLNEEMYLNAELQFKTIFIYKTVFNTDMTEHEVDHVFTGISDDTPLPDPTEVAEYDWKPIPFLKEDLRQHPENYTSWFKIAVESIF